ncbi:MAG: methyltransferase [Candidatus Woesearchaeota archaeon]|nr:MAG: methyltransferase [Candidatus Woesearchaeota archaeon]
MLYEPQEDSLFLASFLGKYKANVALDMGTGSGILARELKKTCKKVIAADIDLEAVEQNHDLVVIHTDLFEHIMQKFDLIVFNPPYLPADKDDPVAALDGGDVGNEIILRFLESAKDFLNPKGKILLLYSSRSGVEEIEQAIAQLYKKTLLGSQKHFFEELFVVELKKK